MKLTIQRHKPTGRSTPGTMYVDGVYECQTLEPDPSTPVHEGHPSIPAGTYPVHLTMSPHMGYITPELLAVPGRTAIRIHKANQPEDLLGCTAVGLTSSLDWVSSSKVAFDALMTKLMAAAGGISAEYIDDAS